MGPKDRGAQGDLPRTDLPPKKLPYDEDYFGTGDEEGVVREREASGDEEGAVPEREAAGGKEGGDDGPKAA